MKRAIIILSIVLTLSVTGVLYGNHGKAYNEGTVTLEEEHIAQFPEPMPDGVLDAMVGYPLY